MTNINQAITVNSKVSINHLDLGRLFAEWDNEEQSEFLLGMLLGLHDLGSVYLGIQLQLIMEAAELAGHGQEMEELAELLSYYLRKTKE